jgi:tripartite-type tricarboxylate transporter receptor subunit TctC
MTGTEIVPVGYRGSAPALNDLVAGSIDLMFDNITSSINLARGGRIRVLGVTSEQRTPLAPDFPTIAETVPGYDVSTFFGVVVRAGTPPDVVAKIETAVVALAQEPAAKERLAGVSAEAVGSSAEDFTQFLASERSRWGQLITELGIRIE